MKTEKWLQENSCSLSGKTVVLTGATGGLGGALCRCILSLKGNLILVDRNPQKAEKLRITLLEEFPGAEIERVQADLEKMEDVKRACEILKTRPVDILIHNAGAYHLPRQKCPSGYDNVFQINFVSPYYITRQLLSVLQERQGKVVAVGSIAHAFVHTDSKDPQALNRRMASFVYGNSKRFLMFSLSELMKKNPAVRLSAVHPGITFTNITSHYPKIVLKIIKWPMKMIFMSPKKAALSAVKGIFETVPYLHWIGPKYLYVWGKPQIRRLTTCTKSERNRIFKTAENIYEEMQEKSF